jgi:hypothetical protein
MFCTPFSHDIPRGESTFLVLSMKHNNIATNMRQATCLKDEVLKFQ